MRSPRTLVVVTPRERFAHAIAALDRLLANTEQEHDLLYLDAFFPGPRRRGLRRRQLLHGFKTLQVSRREPPNRVRNRALHEAAGYDYVVFIDNDIEVERGWLRALVSCAEEVGADVCGPMCLEQRGVQKRVHVAGGDATIEGRDGLRRYSETHDLAGSPTSELPTERRETGLAEFHCMLARRNVFDLTGELDERLPSLLEHGDFCMSVRAAGGRIWFEPGSVVTYVTPPALGPLDLLYFSRRWSKTRMLASVEYFRRKWDVLETSPGLESATGFNRWHRRLPVRLFKQWLQRE